MDELNSELEKKVDRNPVAKQKRAEQKASFEKLTQIVAIVFCQLCDRVTTCYSTVHSQMKATVDSKEKDFFDEAKTKVYKLYAKRMVSIFAHPQKTHLLNLYITTLSQVCGDHPHMCSSVTSSAIGLTQVISDFTQYLKTEHNKLKGEPNAEVSEDTEPFTDDDIANDMTTRMKELTRRVCWFLGTISFNLVQIKSEQLTLEQMKEEQPSQKMARMLMESKVLSGGIENRFLNKFDQETKDKL
jgi:hypothetical protein